MLALYLRIAPLAILLGCVFCLAPDLALGQPPGQKPEPCLTIAQIQGAGTRSPYDGASGLACVRGCVTGVAADGFYLQSTTPDGLARTSEGIFVYRWSGWMNPRKLRPGDLLEIRNFGVQEFYGSTEIVKLKSDRKDAYERLGACPLPLSAALPSSGTPETDPELLYEAFEGMRVATSLDGIVTGPTTRYVSRFPAGDPEITLVDAHSPSLNKRAFAGERPVGRGMIYLSGGLGQDLPAVGVGDRLVSPAVSGILAYQFERYVILVDEDSSAFTVVPATRQENVLQPIGPDEFTVCTFNVENLFDAVDDGDGDMGDWSPTNAAEFGLQLEKRARALREDMQHCTVVGLQEVEGKDAVWAALAAAAGGYRFDYYESMDPRDITVGILYDPRRVRLRHSEQKQACGETDFGVDYSWAQGPRVRRNPCRQDFPRFGRPPYVADLTIQDANGDRFLDVRVIVTHLKSRRGDETMNRQERLTQAQHVAELLHAQRGLALGDFNDLPASETLAVFEPFVDLYDTHVLAANRYTYIYNGLAESPDYIFLTRDLLRYVVSAQPVHINADFPDLLPPDPTSRRSSDHDPLLARFTFLPDELRPAWRVHTGGWWRRLGAAQH